MQILKLTYIIILITNISIIISLQTKLDSFSYISIISTYLVLAGNTIVGTILFLTYLLNEQAKDFKKRKVIRN